MNSRITEISIVTGVFLLAALEYLSAISVSNWSQYLIVGFMGLFFVLSVFFVHKSQEDAKQLLEAIEKLDPDKAFAVGTAFGVGVAVDTFLFPLGIPPVTTGIVWAISAFGLLNGAYMLRLPKQLRVITKEIETALSKDKMSDLKKILDFQYGLWDKKGISDKKYQQALHKIVTSYLKRLELIEQKAEQSA